MARGGGRPEGRRTGSGILNSAKGEGAAVCRGNEAVVGWREAGRGMVWLER